MSVVARGLWLLLALTVASWRAVPASADSEPKLWLLCDGSVAGVVRTQIERALSSEYRVESRPTRSWSQQKRRRALQRQLARSDLDLVLVATVHKRTLQLRYIDVQAARSLGTAELRLTAGRLSSSDRARVLAVTRDHSPARDDAEIAAKRAPSTLDRDAGSTGAAEQARPGQREVAAEQARPGRELAAEQARPGPREVAVEQAPAKSAGIEDESDPNRAGGAPLAVQLEAGAGSSYRGVELTSAGVKTQFDTGLAFAVDIGLRVHGPQGEAPSWLFAANYQTSLGLDVDELHVNAPAEKVGVRTHHLEAAMGLHMGLGSKRGWSLCPMAGYSMRSLAPELHHALIPFYTLGGPFLRAELSIPWQQFQLGFRFAPEAQWLPQASALVGGNGASGLRLAVGARAVAFLHLGTGWDIELAFRESHAWVHGDGVDVTDVERLILARGVWRP